MGTDGNNNVEINIKGKAMIILGSKFEKGKVEISVKADGLKGDMATIKVDWYYFIKIFS